MDKTKNSLGKSSENSEIISIGSCGLMDLTLLYAIMNRFRKEHPTVQYELHTNSTRYITEQLRLGVLDFAVLMEPLDLTKFDYLSMNTTERFGLFVNKRHFLAKKKYITKNDLLGLPLIMIDYDSLQKKLKSWMGESFSLLNIFATHNMLTDAIMLIENGTALAVSNESAINYFYNSRLQFIPFDPELSAASILAWKKRRPDFGIAYEFLCYLQNAY